MVSAMDGQLPPDAVDPALKLLRACVPPNDDAISAFIDNSISQLDREQQRSTLSLVTWPTRGPGYSALGRTALKHFPGATEIIQMWRRWIREGAFDGRPSKLARVLSLAAKDRIPGLDDLAVTLEYHVRGYLRSGSAYKVMLAVEHLRANVDERTSAVPGLCAQAFGVSSTYEWEDWAKRDPEGANEMAHYVRAFLQQAESDGDWSKARQNFEQAIEIDPRRRPKPSEDCEG
jgi:hypothetical protein